MTALALLLALVGLVCLPAAAFMVSLPLGVLVAGVESLATAYVVRYLGVRREAARRAG